MNAVHLEKAQYVVRRLKEIADSRDLLANNTPREAGVRLANGSYINAPSDALAPMLAALRKGFDQQEAALRRTAAQIGLVL